ncbi:hypothetical protein ZWY2020_043991 [Hordeum vulgare]|nr:hypothetical protein ZWY2020_043991 [Hordeum vulgare]
MATKGYQAQAPAMPAAGDGGGGGGGSRAPRGAAPPRRRGQVKEKIVKDMVAAVANMAAGLVRADKNGAGGISADANWVSAIFFLLLLVVVKSQLMASREVATVLNCQPPDMLPPAASSSTWSWSGGTSSRGQLYRPEKRRRRCAPEQHR